MAGFKNFQQVSGFLWVLKFASVNKINRHHIIELEFLVFNATFRNISAISWRPVLVVKEAEVPGKNHRPWASNW